MDRIAEEGVRRERSCDGGAVLDGLTRGAGCMLIA